jgi:hypothetical protein
MAATAPAPPMLTAMQARYGNGPAQMLCENCEHLRCVSGDSRIVQNGKAHNSKPLLLFRCARAIDNDHWSLKFGSCGLFRWAR